MQIVYPVLQVFLNTETENFSFVFQIRLEVFSLSVVNLGLLDVLSVSLYYSHSNSLWYQSTIDSKSDDFLTCIIAEDILIRVLSSEDQQIS